MNTLYETTTGISAIRDTTSAINCSVPFVLHADTRNQQLQTDPAELYYNPSTHTLFCDNFSGAHSNLIEGSAIELTHDDTNHTTETDVNFSEGTSVKLITSVVVTDTFLVSNTSNELKTITALKLKEDIRLSAGSNLSYGTTVNSNTLNLDTTLTDLVSLQSISNDLEIKTTTNNEIQFKTNTVERASIDSTKLDLTVDVNPPLRRGG